MSKEKTFTLYVEQAELAVRIIEAIYEVQRPAGVSADEMLKKLGDDTRADGLRASMAALEYLTECINQAGRATANSAELIRVPRVQTTEMVQ